MQKITTHGDLRNAIKLLEKQQALELSNLKNEVLAVGELLKPANIMKSAFHKLSTTPDLRKNAFKAAIGLATGAVTKKLFMGKVSHPVTKLVVGAILGWVTAPYSTNAVSKIKSLGGSLLKKLFRKTPTGETVGEFM